MMDSAIYGVAAFVVVFIAVLIGFRAAGWRFAAQQRRLGRWDEYGPLEETTRPSGASPGGEMSERLEVIGEWKGEVRSRRRPHEPPAGS
jgi:hypothetical protein